MTALAAELGPSYYKIKRFTFTLPANAAKVWKGATVMGVPATGLVQKGTTAASLLFLGVANQTVDNSANGSQVPLEVDLLTEKTVLYRANDGTITAADLFNPCYVLDDQTVTGTSTGATEAGIIIIVDPVAGVGFVPEGF